MIEVRAITPKCFDLPEVCYVLVDTVTDEQLSGLWVFKDQAKEWADYLNASTRNRGKFREQWT